MKINSEELFKDDDGIYYTDDMIPYIPPEADEFVLLKCSYELDDNPVIEIMLLTKEQFIMYIDDTERNKNITLIIENCWLVTKQATAWDLLRTLQSGINDDSGLNERVIYKGGSLEFDFFDGNAPDNNADINNFLDFIREIKAEIKSESESEDSDILF